MKLPWQKPEPVHQVGPADPTTPDPTLVNSQLASATPPELESPLKHAQSVLDSSPPVPSAIEQQNGAHTQLPSAGGVTDPAGQVVGHNTWAGLRPDDLNPLGGFDSRPQNQA